MERDAQSPGQPALKLAKVPIKIIYVTFFKYFCYFVPACFGLLLLKLCCKVSPLTYSLIAILTIVCYELIIVSTDDSLKKYINFSKMRKTRNSKGCNERL